MGLYEKAMAPYLVYIGLLLCFESVKGEFLVVDRIRLSSISGSGKHVLTLTVIAQLACAGIKVLLPRYLLARNRRHQTTSFFVLAMPMKM